MVTLPCLLLRRVQNVLLCRILGFYTDNIWFHDNTWCHISSDESHLNYLLVSKCLQCIKCKFMFSLHIFKYIRGKKTQQQAAMKIREGRLIREAGSITTPQHSGVGGCRGRAGTRGSSRQHGVVVGGCGIRTWPHQPLLPLPELWWERLNVPSVGRLRSAPRWSSWPPAPRRDYTF